MSEVKLLPLPELHLRFGHLGEDALAYATDYARANMEPLIAENERLAEALREVDEQLGDVECESSADARAVERCQQTIRAALDQEGGNG